MSIIRNLLKPLSFLPAIFIMYLIFSFSSQDGVTSAELSYKVSYKIVEIGGEILDADLQTWEIENYAHRFHGPIRKIAHMTEYFALAISMSFPLYVYGLRGIWLMLVAGFLCVGFACADEYHQSQVAGRMPSKKDIAIDSFGIFWGIILVRIVGWTGRKTIFRPFCKKKNKIESGRTAQSPYPPTQYPSYVNGYQQDNLSAPSVYPPNHPAHPVSRKSARRGKGKRWSDESVYTNSSYMNSPYPNTPYPSQTPYPKGPYINRPYNGIPGPYAPYQQYQQQKAFTPAPAPTKQFAEETSYSDSLSEDMSFKKLMHDIKDQKKTYSADMKHTKKPSIDGTDIPDRDGF